MRLNKKINDNTIASACYAGEGIALRISGNGDKFANSIAIVECVDGELCLTLFDDVIERYGVKIQHENVGPEIW